MQNMTSVEKKYFRCASTEQEADVKRDVERYEEVNTLLQCSSVLFSQRKAELNTNNYTFFHTHSFLPAISGLFPLSAGLRHSQK